MSDDRERGGTLRSLGRGGGRIRSELDEEFAFHLEMRIRELERQGLPRAAAREQALRLFGDVEAAREACAAEHARASSRRRRRVWLEELRQDLPQGLRQLARRPLLSAAAICTLALGIGGTTALFSAADHILLRPLPYTDGDRVVAVWKTDTRSGATRLGVSPADFADWSARTAHLDTWGLAEPFGFDDTGGERPVPVDAWLVTSGFFDALGARTAAGRLFTAAEYDGAVRAVVLGHEYWQRHHAADPAVIGRTLQLDGVGRTIVGVLAPGIDYPAARAIWAPRRLTEAELQDRRSAHMFAVARLAPGATVAAAAAELGNVNAQLAAELPATNTGVGAALVPLSEQVLGSVRTALLVLLGAVGLVLLIACANVGSLLLARDLERRGEFALRAALGAGRRRLIHQLMVESLTLAAAGGVAGVAVAWLAIRLFHLTGAALLPRAATVTLDARVLGFAAALTVLTALVFGALPALRASRADPGAALRAGGRSIAGDRGRDRAQRLLVRAEVATAFVLVVGAGLLVRSFVVLLDNDPGFAVDGRVLLQAHIWDRNPSVEQRILRAETIEAALASHPGVIAAGITTAAPFHPQRVDPQSTLLVEGEPAPLPGDERRVVTILASPRYFDAMGMRLLHGRAFTPHDRLGAPGVAIINETAARTFLPGTAAVGRRVRFGVFGAPREWEVVGVVRDTRPFGFDSEPQPEAYVPFAQHGFGSVTWLVHVQGDAAAALLSLQQRVWQVDPGQSIYEAATIERLVADTLLTRRFHLLLLGALSALAMLLAAIGVYGLIDLQTRARRREIGIRIALGARRADVIRMIVRDALRLAVPGIVIGGAAALVLTRFMHGMLYGVPHTDAATYVPLATLMLAVAAAAALLPAARAVQRDPVGALRE